MLADPQTSGGLLVAVNEDRAADFETFTEALGFNLKPLGKLVTRQENLITVN